MLKTLEKIQTILLYIVIAAAYLLVLPISPNPYVVPKLAVLTFGFILIIFIKTARLLMQGKSEIKTGKYDFPVLLLLAGYILSTIFVTPNKMEALLSPGSTSVIVLCALAYLFVNQLDENGKKVMSLVHIVVSFLMSVVAILALIGVFAKIPQLPAFVRARGFSVDGGLLPLLVFLIASLPICISTIVKEKDVATKAIYSFFLFPIVIGIILSAFYMLPGKPLYPRFPSANASWIITVESLKASPLLGIGPGNYVTAFNRFRPIAFNATDLWAVKFSTASNYFFTVMTEGGLISTAAIILILVAVAKQVQTAVTKKDNLSPHFISLLIVLISMAILPATTTTILFMFVLLAISGKTKTLHLNLSLEAAQLEENKNLYSKIPAILISIPIILGSLYAGFIASKMLVGEYRFYKALVAVNQNKPSSVYQNLIGAIKANPKVDRYHTTASQVTLAFATSLAKKENVSDKDRQDITTFVQQAIQEAKTAVALNPTRAGNWEILGRTYQNIIPVAKGADTFAIQSYTQAIVLDPLYPLTRVTLGGLYFTKGDVDTAQKVLELAVATKTDLANSHYNLAFVLKEKGKTDEALKEYAIVLSLLDKESADYKAVTAIVEELQSKKKLTTEQETQDLTTPEKEPTPAIVPPIELPEGSEPPAAEPSASPSVTPSLTPTSTPAP